MAQQPRTPVKARLAANVRFLRVQAGKSQRQIECASGVSQKTISNIEDPGAPNSPLLSNIEKLADCFQVPMAGLIELELSESDAEPGGLVHWLHCYSGLTKEQKRLVLALARELTGMHPCCP